MNDAAPEAAPDDGRAAAIEIASQIQGEAPAEAPADPAGETPADGTTVIDLPGMDEVRAKAAENAAKRAEQEQSLAPMRALEARVAEQLAALPSGPSVPVADLNANLVAALTAAGVDIGPAQKKLAEAQLKPDAMQVLSRILDEKLAPILEREQPKPAPPPDEAATLDTAKTEFGAWVEGSKSEYPTLARLSPRVAAEFAWEYVSGLRGMGNLDTITNDQIASALERTLSPGTPPAPNGGNQGNLAPSGDQLAANGGDSGASRSITNGLAADAPRSPPQGRRAELQDAIQFAKTLGLE